MAQIIKTNGEVVEVEPKNGTDFVYAELTKIVGGYIEIVSVPDGRLMVVNEEGKIQGLAFNKAATDLYNVPTDFIVGDVLVCAPEQIK